MLCVGSSLEVYPVAGLPELTLAAGGARRDRHPGPDALRRRARRCASTATWSTSWARCWRRSRAGGLGSWPSSGTQGSQAETAHFRRGGDPYPAQPNPPAETAHAGALRRGPTRQDPPPAQDALAEARVRPPRPCARPSAHPSAPRSRPRRWRSAAPRAPRGPRSVSRPARRRSARRRPSGARARAHLGQQRLQPDPELQRRLARPLAVEVGAGAQQQRLAGVGGLAAAEHGGDPLLRAQRLGAAARAGRRAGRSIASAPAAVGDLVAGAVAEPGRRAPVPRARRRRAGPAVASWWACSARLTIRERLVDELVARSSVESCRRASQASASSSLLERPRADHGQRGSPAPSGPASLGARCGLPRRAPAAPQPRGEPASAADDEHVLGLARRRADEVAAVAGAEPAGEVELDEGEEVAAAMAARLLADVGAGGALVPCLALLRRAASTSRARSGPRGCRSRRSGRSGAPTGRA